MQLNHERVTCSMAFYKFGNNPLLLTIMPKIIKMYGRPHNMTSDTNDAWLDSKLISQ